MTNRTRFLAYVLVLGLAAAIIFVSMNRLADSVSEARRDATAAEKTAKKNGRAAAETKQAVKDLAAQVRSLGEKPVVEPSELPNAGDPPAPALPTAAQVAAAVADYCTFGRCKGDDGASPTATQLNAAVSRYCAPGRCQGKDGADGADGANGATGADGQDGTQGPGPTDQQIADAVAAYCSAGNCRGAEGPPGAPGQDGTDGTDGRGVSSLSCDSVTPFTLRVVYTDGTSETYTCGGPAQP